jgi:FtsP/CotA-like multicopper oxidase with cupredoxin domain
VFLDMTLAPGSVRPVAVTMDDGEAPALRFVYADAASVRAAPLAEPAPLPPNPLPERMDFRGALRRDIVLGSADARDRAPWWVPAWGADARPSPLFSLRRGRTAMLAFLNRSDAAEVFHLHGYCARLLDNLDDGWKPFWLDTILVPPQQTARIAFVADNPGKWLIERRALGRPEGSTAAWFEVT